VAFAARFAPRPQKRCGLLSPTGNLLLRPSDWHDLESAVKLVLALTLPCDVMPPRDLTVEKALAHWERVAQHTVARYMQPLMELARAGDHAGLVAELSKSRGGGKG
jgi:hypothetical protein